MRPRTGKRGVEAALAIGVRQHSAYQRTTLLEKRRQRTAPAPAVSSTRPDGYLENVSAACVVKRIRPLKEFGECLTVLAVADEAEAGRRRNIARDAAHAAAPAAKRKVERHAQIVGRVSRRRNPP